MAGWTPADSSKARAFTKAVIARVARTGSWDSSDVEQIADAWTEYADARYDDGRGDERQVHFG